MARVGQVDIGGFNRARGSAVSPEPRGGRPNVAAGFDAAARAVEELQRTREANSLARDAQEIVKARGQFDRRVNEGLADLDPTAANYETQVQQVLDDARAGVMETEFETDQAREELSLRLEQSMQGVLTDAASTRREALNTNALELHGQAQDAFLAAVRQDPDNIEAHAQTFAEQLEGIRPSLTPEQIAELEETTNDKIIIAQAEGLALQGRHEEARAVLDGSQEELTPEVFRFGKQLVRSIENDQKNQNRAAAAGRITDLEIQIIDAQDPRTLSQLRAEVEQADADGLFEGRPGAKSVLIRQIESKRQSIIKAGQDQAAAITEYSSGLGNTSQKNADLTWPAVIQQNDPDGEMGPGERTRLGAEFASKSGFVPSEFQNVMESAERQAKPDLLASAAAVYSEFADVAPEAKGVADVGDRVLATAEMAEAFGMSFEDAAARVVADLPDTATLKFRKEQFGEEFTDFDAAGFLESQGVVPSAFLGIFGTTAEMGAQASSDFTQMLRVAYNLSGDPEVAKRVAARRFGQVYGQTSVGGQARMVKLPPEQLLARVAPTVSNLTPEERARIIEADIENIISERGIAVAVAEPGIDPDELTAQALGGEAPADPTVVDVSGTPRFQLVADERTERELARGEAPTYVLGTRDEFTAYPTQGRYRLPSAAELADNPEYQRIVKEAEDRLRRTREERRAIQESPLTGTPR